MSDFDERRMINGEMFEKMVLGGASNLLANVKTVNDLNVFPIPDGDTGENMYLTMRGGVDGLSGHEGESLGEKASAVAQGMLLSARGNSGVILSQLFYGLAEGLQGLETATLYQFSEALKQGVKCAYGAVIHPVEGTILTVAREGLEHACLAYREDMELKEFFTSYLQEMKISLENTPNLLAVLKEAGVIDSGGAGLVYIAEGVYNAICGVEVGEELAISSASSTKALDFSKFNADTVMEFGYCTEALLQLQHAKTVIDDFSVQGLIDFLETVGDSIVAVKTGTVVKVHVHTMEPWKVLQHCQRFGEFLTVKIENMTLQHNESVKEEKTEIKRPRASRRKYATVAVAAGEGLTRMFLDMGADYVVSGGQTNNPSAEEFSKAFYEVNADYIFVLPNNGNVVLAAKQAAELYADSKVIVIESKSIGEGYSALSMLDYSPESAEEIAENMKESMQGTLTGMVARAVRDASLNGIEIRKDGYMGFTDHTMLVFESTKLQAACALADKLSLAEKEFFIAVYNQQVTEEEKAAFNAYVAETYPNVELYEIEGGQDVYDFLFIVE